MLTLKVEQVREHNSTKSCWIVIHGKVYDVTDFLSVHPGGSRLILQYAGRDATVAFDEVHGNQTLEENLPKDRLVGILTPSGSFNATIPKSKEELRIEKERKVMPPLDRMRALSDFEAVARRVMPAKTFAFWASGADDEVTLRENSNSFSRYRLIPRVLRPTTSCDLSVTMLGCRSALPFYVSATSLGKLAHAKAETNVTRAAGQLGIVHMVSTHATSTPEEICQARVSPDQPLWFQLYKKADNNLAGQLVKKVERLGFNAICLTVDAVAHGNRERDLRAQTAWDDLHTNPDSTDVNTDEIDHGGTSGALLKGDDSDMTWKETVAWLNSISRLPIVIKGIQSVEDAVEAVAAGVQAIIISNHGGRQMEYSLPSIDVLYQLRVKHPSVFSQIEVYMDGGVHNGRDIIKALCLGAKAVGIGRPMLYANGTYAELGIIRAGHIMQEEIVAVMNTIGEISLAGLNSHMLLAPMSAATLFGKL